MDFNSTINNTFFEFLLSLRFDKKAESKNLLGDSKFYDGLKKYLEAQTREYNKRINN
jgi:hypothetical protein